MAIYKMKGHMLEGPAADIIEALLNEHREHLYGRNMIKLYEPEKNTTLTYYKTKTKHCSACGTIHGKRIQLISGDDFEDFSARFEPATCGTCRAHQHDGTVPEERPFDKEWLEDDHETLAAT